MARNYDNKLTMKLIAAISKSIPEISPYSMKRLIKNPRYLKQALEKALYTPPELPFPIWKTITLGCYQTGEDFRQALVNGGFKIRDSAAEMLTSFKVAEKKTAEICQIHLVKVKIVEILRKIGFKKKDLYHLEMITYKDVFQYIKELGLKLCLAEVGPQLRLEYLNQPYGESVIIGMEPIITSNNRPQFFIVERDVNFERFLGSHFFSKNDVLSPVFDWIFALHLPA